MAADSYWSMNAASLEFDFDRRSGTKWARRAGLKTDAKGRYRLRELVAVVADAGLVGSRERFTAWGRCWTSKEVAARFSRELVRALRRLPAGTQRPALEVLAESLRSWLEECEASMHEDADDFERTPSPAWARMSERELRGSLQKMVVRSEPVTADDPEVEEWCEDADQADAEDADEEDGAA